MNENREKPTLDYEPPQSDLPFFRRGEVIEGTVILASIILLMVLLTALVSWFFDGGGMAP